MGEHQLAVLIALERCATSALAGCDVGCLWMHMGAPVLVAVTGQQSLRLTWCEGETLVHRVTVVVILGILETVVPLL